MLIFGSVLFFFFLIFSNALLQLHLYYVITKFGVYLDISYKYRAFLSLFAVV